MPDLLRVSGPALEYPFGKSDLPFWADLAWRINNHVGFRFKEVMECDIAGISVSLRCDPPSTAASIFILHLRGGDRWITYSHEDTWDAPRRMWLSSYRAEASSEEDAKILLAVMALALPPPTVLAQTETT